MKNISYHMISWSDLKSETFKIRCRIYNKNAFSNVKLLFDTGSTTTSIRKDFLQKIGIDTFIKGKNPIRTGNGIIYLNQCEISKFIMGNILFEGSKLINVFEVNKDDITYHGVIGMDFISKINTLISKDMNKIFISAYLEKLIESIKN